MADSPPTETLNFIEQIIDENLRSGQQTATIKTRFPPEPNGYLHIGHAKAICLNFGIAAKYGGKCNLRFDDTNPETEDTSYVNSIMEDVRWLGFDWDGEEKYASDYFHKLFDFATKLVQQGAAYVDSQSAEEISDYRGTPTEPGKLSPFRDRPVEESLDLLTRMKEGDFPEGSHVLRAKIDMSSPNMHLRDPILYRIKHVPHHRTGDEWKIYPTYDFAHGQSDSLEEITYSLCSLEFEVHRPLYDWLIEQLEIFPSRQIEFARLNLSYTLVTKRKLKVLVEEGFVSGWDDPRMPTISGLRRRGYTPAAIRNFCDKVGVARRDGIIDTGLLEHSIREDLNKTAKRAFAVLDPIKLIVTNYPEGKEEMMKGVVNPEDENAGFRELPFERELYIERDDFMEDPPKKFFRLGPGREVRLKYAYIVRCTDFKKDAEGNIVEIHCEYDPQTKSGADTSGKKVKGTIHWLSAKYAQNVEVRLYDRLFSVEDPAADKSVDFRTLINENSLEVISNVLVEPSLTEAKPGDRFQFERKGYFVVDENETEGGRQVFNRTVTLRDSWAKVSAKGK